MAELKERLVEIAINEIDNRKDELVELSNYIWHNPELGYKEYKACKVLADTLEKEGFQLTRKAAGLDTAFVAVKEGGPKKDPVLP